MPTSINFLKAFRLTHRYLGIFIAPMLLFFSVSGSLQTFSLHETSQGSSYQPPHWIMTLAQMHKDQTDIIPARKLKPSSAPKADKPKGDEPTTTAAPPTPAPTPLPTAKWHEHLAMKIFFLLVALGLFTSTLTGLYMAYKFERSAWVVSGILLAGVVVPLVLLKF